jgi:hypothetical protein
MTGPDPMTAIIEATITLDLALGRWRARADPPTADQLRASTDAVAAIDRLLGDLYAVRAMLVAERRQASDATAARVDALLAGAGHGLPASDVTPSVDGERHGP